MYDGPDAEDQDEGGSNGSSDRAEIEEGSWKNEQYWALPENVRNAIDVAKMKKKHSDFYYRLRLLNDKIHIYTSIFYSKSVSRSRPADLMIHQLIWGLDNH